MVAMVQPIQCFQRSMFPRRSDGASPQKVVFCGATSVSMFLNLSDTAAPSASRGWGAADSCGFWLLDGSTFFPAWSGLDWLQFVDLRFYDFT